MYGGGGHTQLCWMGDAFCLSVSHPTPTQHSYWPCLPFFPVFLHFWHCDISQLFCLSHSDKICSFRTSLGVGGEGGMQHSKPLHLWGNLETPCPPWSICHHAECQEVSLGLTSGHCSPWHLVSEKKKGERKRQRKKEMSRGSMDLTKAVKQIRPTQQSLGRTELAVSTSH